MRILIQNKLKLFLVLSLVVTLPFALLVLFGQIKNETGLIMIFPVIAGLPWVLIYIILPFDISGFTSPPSPSTSGDMVLSMGELLIFMIPVYINIYLLTLVICNKRKTKNILGCFSFLPAKLLWGKAPPKADK